MLTTGIHNFDIHVSDSSVIVYPGTARIGNLQMHFPGAVTTFAQMLRFSGDTSAYQNVLLYLQTSDNLVPDMTRAVSSPAASVAALTLPILPTDATFTEVSPCFPISNFTLYSGDGTVGSLISYNKI